MELMDSVQVCELLQITPNNLHQIQFRKQLNWIKKEGKKVFYDRAEVEALKLKRKWNVISAERIPTILYANGVGRMPLNNLITSQINMARSKKNYFLNGATGKGFLAQEHHLCLYA